MFSPLDAVAAPRHTIPFQLCQDHIVLSASVNCHSGNLILDTGSNRITLDRDWAIAAGVTARDGAVKALGVGATTASLAEVPSISVGSVELLDETVALLALDTVSAEHKDPIHGTLGFPFFDRFTIEIDYPGRQLRLWSPSEYNYARNGAIIPVDLARRVPMASARLDLGTGSALDARLLFDLGTRGYGAILGWRAFVEHLAILEPLLSASHEPGVGVGGSVTLRTFLAERIDIGPYSVPSPLVAVSGSGDGFFDVTWADGTLGAPAYMDATVVIDYARSRIIVERAS